MKEARAMRRRAFRLGMLLVVAPVVKREPPRDQSLTRSAHLTAAERAEPIASREARLGAERARDRHRAEKPQVGAAMGTIPQ
jgi:hypothetical protein